MDADERLVTGYTVGPMRLGVLDIGSNTGHLLVFDAHDGAAPLPAFSHKEPLRLAEHLDEAGEVSERGRDALTDFVASSVVVAEDKGCEEVVGFATSAVRDAGNSDQVLDHVHDKTGVRIDVLSGEDEARLTFLAVRRWFGWSAGRLSVFDIGGGSLEIAGGADESPTWPGLCRWGRRGSPVSTSRRAAPTRTTSSSCAARSAPRSPETPDNCCALAVPTRRRRRPRPSARWPASAGRRRPATGRSCRGRCR